MTIQEIQAEILRLKQETKTCILAHSYQSQEILEIADYVGDSYGLSLQGKTAAEDRILMCGVRFMAETCKVLSPDKQVFLPNPMAGCPMADQMDVAAVRQAQARYPDCAVVCYINTTSALKTVCDVCVTSSSAVEICRKLPAQDILFVPDQNLAQYVAAQLPEKTIHYLEGGCPKHAMVTPQEVQAARAAHPDALLLVHPECVPAVAKLADYVGSTTGIMDYALHSAHDSFLIATEQAIVQHLQFALPEKQFYAVSPNLICENMKLTTLMDVYHCLKGQGGEEISLPADVIAGARHCIDEMIRLGG